MLLSGCAVPLAPGYQLQKETLTVRFVAGTTPHLAIRAEYRLANIGNSPLHFIAVVLPGEKEFGRANLHAEIDGKEIALQHNPVETHDDWRIPLPAAWRQKEKRDLSLSYDLAAQPASDPRIFVAANTFYLNDSDWFPTLMGFKALFSPPVVRPDPTELSVILPADFRVTASGQPRGTRRRNSEVEYRFRIRKTDFDPYVLVGQYTTQRVSASGANVMIWTFKPIPSAESQQTTAQIAAAAKFYSENFGPLPASIRVLFDVTLPSVANRSSSRLAPESFPLPGVVYDWGFDSTGSHASEGAQLAQTWFAHMISPRRDSWMLSDGLSRYASNLLAEKSGGNESRVRIIQSALSDYDSDKLKTVEKPIVSLTPSDPDAQLELMSDKMQLFFFALDEECGQQNVTHAIAHMVYALRGQQYGYSDFRAALEQECHHNLADFFRSWLNQKGIPQDFGARYQNANGQ